MRPKAVAKTLLLKFRAKGKIWQNCCFIQPGSQREHEFSRSSNHARYMRKANMSHLNRVHEYDAAFVNTLTAFSALTPRQSGLP